MTHLATIDEQRRTYTCAQTLAVFHQKAKKANNKLKRLRLLRQFANFVLLPDPYITHDQGYHRRHFEKRKARGAFYLAGACWVCGLIAECRHHVIQVQHGGRNIKRNIVNLCVSCHQSVHSVE